MPGVLAVPVAVSCVEETNVVMSAVAPRKTCALDRKFAPVTVSKKLPVLMLAGFVPISVGVRFISVTALDADLEESAALVAVTVTVFGEGRELGAV